MRLSWGDRPEWTFSAPLTTCKCGHQIGPLHQLGLRILRLHALPSLFSQGNGLTTVFRDLIAKNCYCFFEEKSLLSFSLKGDPINMGSDMISA